MNFSTAVAVIETSPLRIVATSDFGTDVSAVQLGRYIVTFPAHVAVMGCIATQNNSVGTITATAGSKAGLGPNQVSVVTLNLDNSFAGGLNFTLAAFYPTP